MRRQGLCRLDQRKIARPWGEELTLKYHRGCLDSLPDRELTSVSKELLGLIQRCSGAEKPAARSRELRQ